GRVGARGGRAWPAPRPPRPGRDPRWARGEGRRAKKEAPVPADGGRARPRAAHGRALAVRAEVGRLSRGARERRQGAGALVAERAPAPALLPGAAAARRAPAAAQRPRRRGGDRAGGG